MDETPTGAAHPRQPLTPPPGPGFVERLGQYETWTDRFGQVHRLAEMSDDYLWAVLGYLRWYAPQIRALATQEEAAADVPLALWLAAQPIWGAIACELVRRCLLAHPADAMQRLVASGPLAWEERDGGRMAPRANPPDEK